MTYRFDIKIRGCRTRKAAEILINEILERLMDFRDSGDAPLDWYVDEDVESIRRDTDEGDQ